VISQYQNGTKGDSLYRHNNGQWTKWLLGTSNTVKHFESTYGKLLISFNYFVKYYDQDFTYINGIYNYNGGLATPSDAIFDKEGIIFAVYPDIADLYIGKYLKLKYNLPLIIDLRDLPQSFTSQSKNSKWFNLEKDFFNHADYITVATDTIKQNLIEQYHYPENKIETVYNGFGNVGILESKPKLAEKDFVITYAGTMSDNQKPDILTLAYKKIVEKYPDAAKNITIRIYSQKGYYFHLRFKKTIIPGVEFKGYLPHSELMNVIHKESDVCFLPLASQTLSYALPAKLFEYIYLEKPIVGALPDGDAKMLIEKYGIGKVCHFNDIDGIADVIYNLYTHRELLNEIKNNVIKAKPEFYMKTQISKMRNIIEKL